MEQSLYCPPGLFSIVFVWGCVFPGMSESEGIPMGQQEYNTEETPKVPTLLGLCIHFPKDQVSIQRTV